VAEEGTELTYAQRFFSNEGGDNLNQTLVPILMLLVLLRVQLAWVGSVAFIVIVSRILFLTKQKSKRTGRLQLLGLLLALMTFSGVCFYDREEAPILLLAPAICLAGSLVLSLWVSRGALKDVPVGGQAIVDALWTPPFVASLVAFSVFKF